MVRKKKEFINVSKQIGSLTLLIQNKEMGGRWGEEENSKKKNLSWSENIKRIKDKQKSKGRKEMGRESKGRKEMGRES